MMTSFPNSIVNNTSLKPEWYRAERYDYCENFFEAQRSVPKSNGWMKQMLTKIRAMML